MDQVQLHYLKQELQSLLHLVEMILLLHTQMVLHGTAATETTPAVAAVEPVITSASVASILAWWNAAAANADSGVSTEVSIDIENVEFDSTSAGADGDINAAFADDDYASETSPAYAGVINAAHEVAACTAE